MFNIFKKEKKEFTFDWLEDYIEAIEHMASRERYDFWEWISSILSCDDMDDIEDKIFDDLKNKIEYHIEEDWFITFYFYSWIKLKVECNKYIFNCSIRDIDEVQYKLLEYGCWSYYIYIPQSEDKQILYVLRTWYVFYWDLYMMGLYNLEYIKEYIETYSNEKYMLIDNLIKEKSRRTKELLLNKIDNKQKISLEFLKTFKNWIELENIADDFNAKNKRIKEIKNDIW